ncbi:MAG: AAA family ATPase [Actinophytocola sp.]|nr:AAA family ATPase [Actinophytocola sp.]
MGREHECDRLRAALTAARGGKGRVLLVAGEPGIGKTRLAEEAVLIAASLGMGTAWGRAVDDEGSQPFWPFRQLVRSLAAGSGDPWPRLAASQPEPSPALSELRAQERFRIFEAVTAHLVAAAGDAGLLLVLDDLQWADASSSQLLVHLVRATGRAPVAVVGTYRDTETGGREALRQALGELAREPSVTRLRLAGLTESEVAEQLASVTGAPVPAEFAGAVSRRSKGNPFFVGELAEAVPHAGGGNLAMALPDAVRDAVRGRLAELGERTRMVVTTAAILGTAVDVAALGHVTGLAPEDVLAALDEAAAAGVLHAERWEFGHDLVRDTARAEASRSVRLDAHRRMAEHLGGLSDAGTRSAELAHHWLESLPLGDPAQAVAWAERAAREASDQCAWDEAAELYGRAAETADDPARRCELLIACATTRLHAYQMTAARDAVVEAARLARRLGDGTLLARAALVMEGMNDLTWSADERALCEEALALLSTADSPLRARLLAQLSADRLMSEYHAPGVSACAGELSRSALAMAERLGDRVALRSALHARQIACSGPDGVRERLALGDRFVAFGVADRDDVAEMWGRLWRFDALMQLGDLDGAESVLAPLTAVVDRLRLPLASWHLLRCHGAVAFARGRLQAARSYGDQALALAERGGHLGGLLPSQGFLTLLGTLTGFTDENASRVLDGWEHVRPVYSMMALVHWYVGREDEARRAYAMSPPIAELPGFLLMPAAAGLIELAEAFEDRVLLDHAFRALTPYAALFCCGGAGVIATTGSAHGPLGVAAAALGRLDDGVRHLREAIEVNERVGAPPFAALARYDLARTLARRARPGDRDEAAALTALATATATARELGMAPLLDRVERLAADLAGTTPGPLTRREREIADLVAQGLTNRQIAAIAHISERTAENHVQHILTKLGLSSRTQIATWVTRTDS